MLFKRNTRSATRCPISSTDETLRQVLIQSCSSFAKVCNPPNDVSLRRLASLKAVNSERASIPLRVAMGEFSNPSFLLACAESSTSERVAGVIYAVRTLNDKSLAEGYKLICQVKALPGQDTDSVAGWHHIPIGMIVACDCERPLEELADSIATLNTQFPSTRWADAVSVLSRGLINHAVQFEDHKIGGDFILPNKTGAMQFAMYVHVMVASLGSYTFNRTCGLLFMHLGCFFKKTVLPTNEMVMQGVSRVAVNVRAYMFDATDYLVAVPEEMRQDRGYGLQLMPYRIESQQGKLLSRVQFVPWLGGAAIRVYGDLPLMPFVLFLGKMDRPPQQMSTPEGAISSILPINRNQFELMLARFNR